MVLEDEEARAFTVELARQNDELRANLLAKAKHDALVRGKEPFDLGRLETMCDTSREGRMEPELVRHARFERMYYVDFPSILTLEAFAHEIEELNRW